MLILLLSSDDFATREYATKELKKLTSKIVPQLEAELEKTKDPEVKARLRGLLGK